MTHIILGSYALFWHGFPVKPRDVDILTTKEEWEKCKPNIEMIFEDKGYKKIDVTFNESTMSNHLLYIYCNENPEQCKKLELVPSAGRGAKFLIPPLKILYAVYKSHIHRIIPYTEIQSKNIEIWTDSVKKYVMLRNRIGYKQIDKIMYEEDLGELRDFLTMPTENAEDSLNRYAVRIFGHRFRETNEKLGDTTSGIDKTKQPLHAKVAEAYRGTQELLFTKFQVDGKENMSMDRILWSKGNMVEKIQCVFEDIVVLFLELKWLPEMQMSYKEKCILYVEDHIEKTVKYREILETYAHFATNLCGKGHHWLRRWVLDHSEIFTGMGRYDLVKIMDIGMKIVWSDDEIQQHSVKSSTSEK